MARVSRPIRPHVLRAWLASLGFVVASLALALAAPAAARAEPPAPEAMPSPLCRGAREGLTVLWSHLPGAHVTSATRDRVAEARAWADNIARRRTWMRILKAASRPELAAAQRWIDAHWKELRGRPEPIADHLREVFAGISDGDMGRISPHFAGRAIDLRKQRGLGRRALGRLPNVRSVLDEGDHWHVDFTCEPPEVY